MKILGRGVIVILLVAPPAALMLLNPNEIHNLYVLMLIAMLIPATLCAFLLFGIVDEVCYKLRLYDINELENQEIFGDEEELTKV